ncbi:MAG: MFS transporter [Chloroflexi bacterium]|nr:MAG: MFS transporter [Chloroflexota bacterium]
MVRNSKPPVGEGGITITWRKIIVCILLTLVGFNLRSVILGIPPILPLIQHDLRLNYTTAGLLTALPLLVLAAAAWPSGLLAERIGARACVSIGLALLGGGALMRALWPIASLLLLFTLLMSLGIALAQTAVPVLARRWFPAQIGFVSALFSDGLIFGEAVAAGITVPVMVHFWGGDAWTATLILWSIPVIALLMLWLWLAPPAPGRSFSPEGITTQAAVKDNTSTVQRTRVNALHLGFMIGAGSLIYFGMNAWIASYNQAIHYAYLTSAALTILNVSQLPSSLGVTFFAQRLAGRRWPFVATGAVCFVAITGWVFMPAPLQLLWAALLGGSSAVVFTLGIALPPLLARPGEVARLTGITISLTYAVAFVGPLIGGQLWDLFHLPAVAFLPVALASVMLIVLGMLLPSHAAFGLSKAVEYTPTNKSGAAKSTPPTT